METQTFDSRERTSQSAKSSKAESVLKEGTLKLIDRVSSTMVSPEEPTIFDKSKTGRVGYSLPRLAVPEVKPASVISAALIRDEVEGFPEVSENEVVRHFVKLSQKNYCIDTG